MENLQPVHFVEHLLRKYAKPESRILDVGCGPALYRNATKARYIGLDMHENAYVEFTNKKMMDVVASSAEIPFSDSTFDLVLSKSAFYQFPDPQRCLKEFYRVLRPSGRILICDYNKRTQKVLQVKEGCKRPCWTAKELKGLVEEAGFNDCELLAPVTREICNAEKYAHLLKEELIGQWAIVTGAKRKGTC